MSLFSNIIEEDCQSIIRRLGKTTNFLRGKKILITGANGFLCSYFVDVINIWNKSQDISNSCTVYALDNFSSSKKERLIHLYNEPQIKILNSDVTKEIDIDEIDYIIHGASIASPLIYRKFPLETIEANIIGTKNILDIAKLKKTKNVIIFSSSEIYGDPDNKNIPTPENYKGNVSCTGPRACYDESKRMAETLAYVYNTKYKVSVNIIRPFNFFGPGQNLKDKRIVPDCIDSVIRNRDIVLFSNGKSTRSFCYISDAVTVILFLLLKKPKKNLAYNVGNDEIEISMKDLSKLILNSGKLILTKNSNKIIFKKSSDKQYNTDSPSRRAPDLKRIKFLFNWKPEISLKEGIERTIRSYL